jgi:hypothetical protein
MNAKKKPKQQRQRERFIEAARKVGASEDEADFDKALKKVAKAKHDRDEKHGRRS